MIPGSASGLYPFPFHVFCEFNILSLTLECCDVCFQYMNINRFIRDERRIMVNVSKRSLTRASTFTHPLFLQVSKELSYDQPGPREIFQYHKMQAGAGSWGQILIVSQEQNLSGDFQEYQRLFSVSFFSFSSTFCHLHLYFPAGNA